MVADRDDPESDLPPNPLVPYLTGYVNEAGRSATSQVLLALATQKAWYARGFGCTVAQERPEVPTATKVESDLNPFAAAAKPKMTPEVTAAIGRAFGDDLSRGQQEDLGTRGIVVVKDGQLVGERYAEGFTDGTRSSGGRWPRASRTSSSVATPSTAGSPSPTTPCGRSGPTPAAPSPSTS